jgi:hypothetical protein
MKRNLLCEHMLTQSSTWKIGRNHKAHSKTQMRRNFYLKLLMTLYTWQGAGWGSRALQDVVGHCAIQFLHSPLVPTSLDNVTPTSPSSLHQAPLFDTWFFAKWRRWGWHKKGGKKQKKQKKELEYEHSPWLLSSALVLPQTHIGDGELLECSKAVLINWLTHPKSTVKTWTIRIKHLPDYAVTYIDRKSFQIPSQKREKM